MISINKTVIMFFVTLIKFKVLGGVTLALVGGDCPLGVKEGAVIVVKD
jgi:hypothetical protein